MPRPEDLALAPRHGPTSQEHRTAAHLIRPGVRPAHLMPEVTQLVEGVRVRQLEEGIRIAQLDIQPEGGVPSLETVLAQRDEEMRRAIAASRAPLDPSAFAAPIPPATPIPPPPSIR